MSAKKKKKVQSNVIKKPIWDNIIDPPQSAKFFHRNLWFIVAFAVPFLLMYICFACAKVEPFGDQQILVTDLWHQYYPFLVEFQDTLHSGGSLLWSWASGGGTNYIALIAYYLASPLNFLSVFVPSAHLREFLTVITCAKIGFAGLFFAQFLRITFKKRDITVSVFGILYALCSFIMGYYWNVIWLDTIALLPLVVAGTIALLKDGKFRLYVIALALSVLANYYIGLFTCIFVLLVCIAYCIIEYKSIKDLLTQFFKMADCTVLSLMMTAVLTVPTAIALGTTHSSNNTFPATYAINIGDTADFKGTMQAFAEVISNSVAFVEPTAKEGLPNIYCGVIALVLGLMFFTCSKIKLRERITGGVLLLFFTLSFIIRQLDFIWHGFHFPNMLPHRFSFLFSFVLIVMAYRTFMNLEHSKLYHMLFTTAMLLVVIGIATKYQEKEAIIGTAFIAALILVWLTLYILKIVPKQALAVALFIICVAEGACTAYIGVKTVGTTTTTSYPLGTTDTENIVEYIDSVEKDNEDIFRTEVTKYHTLNDNALIGVNGVSMFSSMTNADVTSYMEKFGLCGWVASNRYTYQESSPFTNLFLNIKYLISPKGIFLDTDHMALKRQSGNVKLLENQYYLPMGFMVNEDLLEYDPNLASVNPFDNQNEIFRLATGLTGNLYEHLEVVTQGHTDYTIFSVTKNSYGNYSLNLKDDTQSPHLKYNYEAPYDGTAYAYFQCNQGQNVDLKVNEVTVVSNYVKRPFIMQMGTVKKGDKLTVYSDLTDITTGTARVYCNMLNEELFQQGYEKLSQSVFEVEKSTDTKIEGTINVKEDGLFYTSIPYDKGFKAYVDSQQVEITPVADALIAFRLPQGEHEIVLKYCPPGFVMGLIMTLLSAVIFVCLILFWDKIIALIKTKKKTDEKASE